MTAGYPPPPPPSMPPPAPVPQGGPGPAKPAWYRRKWVLAAAAVLVAGGIGSAVASSAVSDADMKTDAAEERASAAETRADSEATRADEAEAETDKAEQRATTAEADAASALQRAQAEVADDRRRLQAEDAARNEALEAKSRDIRGRELAVGTAERVQAANTFEDGVYLVGEDIEPGTYKSEGGSNCYWETNDQGGEINDNELVNGPSIMTVRSSDYSVQIGCPSPFVRQ